jgi:hypothetical protein
MVVVTLLLDPPVCATSNLIELDNSVKQEFTNVDLVDPATPNSNMFTATLAVAPPTGKKSFVKRSV